MVDLPNEFHQLAAEWHKELNDGVDFYELSYGSGKRVWWKCVRSELHVWQTEFRSRISGSGCPFCAGKKVCDDNNLKNTFPKISDEWHPSKNKGLSPFQVHYGSHKKVWWQCLNDESHEWETSVYLRTKNKTGCPFCSGRKATLENNFAEKFPDLLLEWHPQKNASLVPSALTPKSGKLVWWRCKDFSDHEWQSPVIERTDRNRGCPHCSKEKKNLVVQRPDLLEEWHTEKNQGIEPHHCTIGSDRKVWWRCKRFPEHEWFARIANRVNGRGCPYCTSQTSEPEIRLVCELRELFGKENVIWRAKIFGHELDIYIENLKLGIEFDGYRWHKDRIKKDERKNSEFLRSDILIIRLREKPLPLLSAHDMSVKTPLKKKDLDALISIIRTCRNDEVMERVNEYLNKNDFVNQKEYRRYLNFLPNPPPEHSLRTKKPDIAEEWNFEKNYPLVPDNFLPFSHKKVWWKCSVGHEFESTIAVRSSGQNCPICSSLKFTMPEIASEWHPDKNGELLPEHVAKNSGKLVWWKCNIDGAHEWKATVDNRSRGTRCPFCFGAKVSPERNFRAEYPELAKEWHPSRNDELKPEDFLPNSNQIVWWRCSLNYDHEWQTSINYRSGNSGTNCPYCSKKRVSTEYNLKVVSPKLAKEWHKSKNGELKPEHVLPVSAKKVWWKCPNGHEYLSAISTRSGGQTCPQCKSLKFLKPELAKEWHPNKNGDLLPEHVTKSSGKKVWWRCSQNPTHEWEAFISNRSKGRGCPHCYKLYRSK